jgi:pilus assembly protein CpaC
MKIPLCLKMKRCHCGAMPGAGWIFISLVLWLSLAVGVKADWNLDFGPSMNVSELQIAMGKSRIITAPMDLDQVLIGNPDVADVRLLSSRRILLLGKQSGRTNLTLRASRSQEVALVDIVVGHDLDGIKRKLHELLPNEGGIAVRSANSTVMLSGEVSTAEAMETALATARSFAGEAGVRNLLQVGGGHQVMLEVRIAEVKRNSLRALGIRSRTTDTSGSRQLEVVTGIPLSGTAFVDGSMVWPDLLLRLEALESRGTAKTLAEPNIVALSGQEASFLAGGEFPVPVVQSGGSDSITVEFKEYGVGLIFTPTVLSGRKIHLRLQTEVSTIDFDNATLVAGTRVPALATRRTGTSVELGDGQSFAIAGLLQENMDNALSQLPGLGNIPVLGALFRSTEFRRNETELAIIVRARLVQPVAASALRLPTDHIIPPSQAEQYLLGQLEGLLTKPVEPGGQDDPRAGGLEGPFGHQL